MVCLFQRAIIINNFRKCFVTLFEKNLFFIFGLIALRCFAKPGVRAQKARFSAAIGNFVGRHRKKAAENLLKSASGIVWRNWKVRE
jgi:hypothetical protein